MDSPAEETPSQLHPRSNRGYFKVWRMMFDSAVWSMPPNYFRLWLWMLAQATHAGNANQRHLSPGTFTTSYRQMADALEWTNEHHQPKKPSLKWLIKACEWFKAERMITIETRKHLFSSITICNWNVYQQQDHTLGNTEENSQENSQGNIFKHVKHVKKENTFVASHESTRCLKAWEQYRPIIEKHRETYLRVFDELHRLDKLPWEGEEGIFAICAFAVKEWTAGMIQAPSKLRKPSKQYPELKTWEVIQGQIRGQREKAQENGKPELTDDLKAAIAKRMPSVHG